jgi:hypothetical protein
MHIGNGPRYIHPCSGALRELVKQNEGHAPAVALLLLAHGATIDEDEYSSTLDWARARYAEAVDKGEDLSACSRLVAQLLQLQPASSSSNSSDEAQVQLGTAQGTASGVSQQETSTSGRPPAWGSDPVSCVRTVLRHVLQNYPREAMRKIAVGCMGWAQPQQWRIPGKLLIACACTRHHPWRS